MLGAEPFARVGPASSKLPQMEAEIILEAPDGRIIMDAKYNQEALGGRYGGKLHPNNLYQLWPT